MLRTILVSRGDPSKRWRGRKIIKRCCFATFTARTTFDWGKHDNRTAFRTGARTMPQLQRHRPCTGRIQGSPYMSSMPRNESSTMIHVKRYPKGWLAWREGEQLTLAQAEARLRKTKVLALWAVDD